MSNTDVMLRASGLATGYRSGDRRIVTRASFTVHAGNIVAFIGPNGCGKTTLLKTLVGLLPTVSGSVSINGLQAPEYRSKHGIGYLPEGLSLPGSWTGRGMIAMAALTAGRAGTADVPLAMEVASIDFDLHQAIEHMSKGMRQRVALAMALLPTPQLLVLDEPEAGLDPAQRVRLRNSIQAFARDGRIVLLASHDVTGLCTIADRIYLMNGQELQIVERAELADPDRILALFHRGVDA